MEPMRCDSPAPSERPGPSGQNMSALRDSGPELPGSSAPLNNMLRDVVQHLLDIAPHADFFRSTPSLVIVHDYRQFVPADADVTLGGMLERAASHGYASVSQFRADLHTLHRNAAAYNGRGGGKHAYEPVIHWAADLCTAAEERLGAALAAQASADSEQAPPLQVPSKTASAHTAAPGEQPRAKEQRTSPGGGGSSGRHKPSLELQLPPSSFAGALEAASMALGAASAVAASTAGAAASTPATAGGAQASASHDPTAPHFSSQQPTPSQAQHAHPLPSPQQQRGGTAQPSSGGSGTSPQPVDGGACSAGAAAGNSAGTVDVDMAGGDTGAVAGTRTAADGAASGRAIATSQRRRGSADGEAEVSAGQQSSSPSSGSGGGAGGGGGSGSHSHSHSGLEALLAACELAASGQDQASGPKDRVGGGGGAFTAAAGAATEHGSGPPRLSSTSSTPRKAQTPSTQTPGPPPLALALPAPPPSVAAGTEATSSLPLALQQLPPGQLAALQQLQAQLAAAAAAATSAAAAGASSTAISPSAGSAAAASAFGLPPLGLGASRSFPGPTSAAVSAAVSAGLISEEHRAALLSLSEDGALALASAGGGGGSALRPDLLMPLPGTNAAAAASAGGRGGGGATQQAPGAAGGGAASYLSSNAFRNRRHKSKVFIKPNKVVYLPTTFVEEEFDVAALPLDCELQVEADGVLAADTYRVTIKSVPRQGLSTMYCMTNVMRFQQTYLNWQIFNWTRLDARHIRIHLQSPSAVAASNQGLAPPPRSADLDRCASLPDVVGPLGLGLGLGLGAVLPPGPQQQQHHHHHLLQGGGGLPRSSEDGGADGLGPLAGDPGSAGRLLGGFASSSASPLPPPLPSLSALLPSPLPPSGGGGGLYGGGRGGGAGSSGSLKRKSDTGRYNLSKVERRVVVMDRDLPPELRLSMSDYVQRPSPIPESPPNASPQRRASTGFQQLQLGGPRDPHQPLLPLHHHHNTAGGGGGGGFSGGGPNSSSAAALGLSLPPRCPGGSVSQSGMISGYAGGSGGGAGAGGGSLSPALQAMAGLPPRPLSAHHSAPHLQLLQALGPLQNLPAGALRPHSGQQLSPRLTQNPAAGSGGAVAVKQELQQRSDGGSGSGAGGGFGRGGGGGNGGSDGGSNTAGATPDSSLLPLPPPLQVFAPPRLDAGADVAAGAHSSRPGSSGALLAPPPLSVTGASTAGGSGGSGAAAALEQQLVDLSRKLGGNGGEISSNSLAALQMALALLGGGAGGAGAGGGSADRLPSRGGTGAGMRDEAAEPHRGGGQGAAAEAGAAEAEGRSGPLSERVANGAADDGAAVDDAMDMDLPRRMSLADGSGRRLLGHGPPLGGAGSGSGMAPALPEQRLAGPGAEGGSGGGVPRLSSGSGRFMDLARLHGAAGGGAGSSSSVLRKAEELAEAEELGGAGGGPLFEDRASGGRLTAALGGGGGVGGGVGDAYYHNNNNQMLQHGGGFRGAARSLSHDGSVRSSGTLQQLQMVRDQMQAQAQHERQEQLLQRHEQQLLHHQHQPQPQERIGGVRPDVPNFGIGRMQSQRRIQLPPQFLQQQPQQARADLPPPQHSPHAQHASPGAHHVHSQQQQFLAAAAAARQQHQQRGHDYGGPSPPSRPHSMSGLEGSPLHGGGGGGGASRSATLPKLNIAGGGTVGGLNLARPAFDLGAELSAAAAAAARSHHHHSGAGRRSLTGGEQPARGGGGGGRSSGGGVSGAGAGSGPGPASGGVEGGGGLGALGLDLAQRGLDISACTASELLALLSPSKRVRVAGTAPPAPAHQHPLDAGSQQHPRLLPVEGAQGPLLVPPLGLGLVPAGEGGLELAGAGAGRIGGSSGGGVAEPMDATGPGL